MTNRVSFILQSRRLIITGIKKATVDSIMTGAFIVISKEEGNKIGPKGNRKNEWMDEQNGN